jgi:NADPH2:quinone reductase
MRTILVREFGGPDAMRLEHVAPLRPAANQVLVRVHAAGVNPVDAYIRSGTYARKPQLPYVPGFDGAGEVDAVGADVNGFKHGDRVYIRPDNVSMAGAGTYAEQVLCTPAELHRLPPSITYSQGATLGIPYGTAYHALFNRAAARPAETVLVHGATGGVGIAAVQLAKAHGLTVIGTGGTDRGLDVVKAQGATLVVNHREPNYLDTVMSSTGGRGVDVVLEMAAHLNLDKVLSILARGGRVVIVGSRGRVEIDPRQTMARNAAILGMALFGVSAPELTSIHAAITAGLSCGALSPVVGREMPLEDAARAHEVVMQSGALSKIVLVM